MPTQEEAATAAAAKLLEGAEEGETPSGESGTEETPTVTELELPSWEIELPENITQLLEEEEEEPEIDDEEEEEFTYEEEGDKDLQKKLKKAQAEAEHYKKLRLQDSRKAWAKEAEKFFPLATPSLPNINAESRRAYLAQAKAAHEAMLPFVKEIGEKAREVVAKEKDKAREEARAEAAKAWGRPAAAVPAVPSDSSAQQERLEKARQRGDLSDRIKAMVFPKEAA